jgi:hypothetical protein
MKVKLLSPLCKVNDSYLKDTILFDSKELTVEENVVLKFLSFIFGQIKCIFM